MSLRARSWPIWGSGVPAPVPRLVSDSVDIAAWVGEDESVPHRVFLQPPESRRAFEFFFEWRETRCGEIHAAPAVMLAVTGRGADAQDVVHVQAARPFAFDEADLVFDGTEGGDDLQLQVCARRGFAHARQRARGTRLQPLHAAMDVRTDRDKSRRLALHAQFPDLAVIAGNAEREGAFHQRAALARIPATGWRHIGAAARVVHADDQFEGGGVTGCKRNPATSPSPLQATTAARSPFS